MIECALEQSNNIPGDTIYFIAKITLVFSFCILQRDSWVSHLKLYCMIGYSNYTILNTGINRRVKSPPYPPDLKILWDFWTTSAIQMLFAFAYDTRVKLGTNISTMTVPHSSNSSTQPLAHYCDLFWNTIYIVLKNEILR